MMAGMIVFPVTSCTSASLGILTDPGLPAATICLPSMTSTEFSIGGRPVPSMSRAPLSRRLSADTSANGADDDNQQESIETDTEGCKTAWTLSFHGLSPY